MTSFAQIAPYLSNPLVLTGFVVLLFFGIHRTLIRAKLIPPLSAAAGKDILSTLLRYGFIIALLIIVAGFGMEGWKTYIGRQETSGATDKLVAGLDEISKGFDALGRQGGLVSSPSTPEQFYHNAKIYELNGDTLNARKAYADYMAFDLAFVDPHLRYQALLKAQDGIEGARQVYAALRSRHDNTTVRFASALLLDRAERLTQLEAVLKAAPEFAPAYYELSREYSQDVVGERTLSDKRQEKNYLEAFAKLDAQGHFNTYFLDKDVAGQFQADATARLKELEFIAPEVLKNPVSVSGMLSNQGWIIYFDVADDTREILYKFPTDSTYTSTGFTSTVDSRTGAPQPNTSIVVQNLKGRYDLLVQYVDLKGAPNGPFSVMFDTDAQLVREAKQTMDILEPASFDYSNGRMTVNFQNTLSRGEAIKEIRYSLDDDSLSKSFPLEPGSPPDASSDESIEVPIATHYVSVQVVYADGTESVRKKVENHIVP